jgi:fucose permease
MDSSSAIPLKTKPFDNCAPVRRGLYALNFLLAITIALTSFFNAPLLISRGIPEWALGIVFACASALAMIVLFFVPRLFNALGGFESFVILATLNAFSLIGLALASGPIATLFFFASLTVTVIIVFLLMDMFLEGSTEVEGETGGTRAFFITMANFAWVGAPYIAGRLSANGDFSYLYLFSAALFIPILLITAKYLHNITDHNYDEPNARKMIQSITKNLDIRNVFIAQFLLRIFYSIMVVYGPIYLINYAGLSISEMGIILSIAMFAFLLFELPAGRIGDKYLGEKEMMVAGLIIISLSTISIAFISGYALWVWALVLFTTRVGAALLEITSESYFFKHVDGNDADEVGAFRALSPLSYIVGPILGTIALIFLPLAHVFTILGLIMLIGVPYALAIKDTR